MARRYGCAPSSFLKQNAKEFQFNMLVASVGIDAESRAQERALRHGKKGRR